MRKSPLLSAAIVVTLAAGVGVDAGVFSLVDGTLFKPRVTDDPDRFIQVTSRSTMPDRTITPLTTLGDYQAFQTQARAFAQFAAWTPVHASVARNAGAVQAERVVPLLVSCNFFGVYGSEQPIAGRLFRADECDEARPAAVAVIGEDLWRTRLGAGPDIVGSTIALDRRPFTVVGIMPAGYAGHLRTDIWIPYAMAAAFFGGRDVVHEPGTPWLMAMDGRLRAGASWAGARTELAAVAARQDRQVPGRVTTLHLSNGSLIDSDVVQTMAFWIVPLIMGALTLVVLLVCANVATLLLSRAAARRQEMAIRMSIGGTRSQLIAMLLTESLVLAVAAAPLAAVFSYAVPWAFRRQVPTMPAYPVSPGTAVWVYLGGTTLLAGIVAGLAPAVEALKRDVAAGLHGYDAPMNKTGRWHARDVLIAVQMTVSLVLLITSGVFVRAEMRLADQNPGYEAAHVVVVAPRIRTPPYTPSRAASFYQQLALRARAIAGVRAVGFASAPPFGAGDVDQAAPQRFAITSASGERVPLTTVNVVSSEYFTVLDIPILRGRVFDAAASSVPVQPVVLSASAARAIASGRDPIGLLVRDDAGRGWQVVGVAGDIRELVSKTGPDLSMYVPRSADAFGDTMVVRFGGDVRPIADAIRQAIANLDPDAMTEPRTLAALRDDLAGRLFSLIRMMIALAAAALALALIGVHGVVAFAARLRLREYGIHMALGATRAAIVRLVLASGLKPILYGAAIGITVSLGASAALTQVFKDAPFPLAPHDPLVYGLVTAVLVIAAVIAMVGPARRAAWSDPALVLRRD